MVRFPGAQLRLIELNQTDQAYFYIPCQPAQAEVELYDIPDAPPQLSRTVQRRNQPPSVITWDNPKAVVMHAHRRDNPNLDAAGQGCSSKMGNGSLIAHNRHALEDRRPWGSTNPQIMYGTIYQYWRRDPGQHPAFPGNEANVFPAPGHYPFDPIFSQGTGTYPPGHPGNNTGLPGTANNGGGGGGAAGGATQAKNLSSKFAGLSLGSKSSKPTKQAPPALHRPRLLGQTLPAPPQLLPLRQDSLHLLRRRGRRSPGIQAPRQGG